MEKLLTKPIGPSLEGGNNHMGPSKIRRGRASVIITNIETNVTTPFSGHFHH